MWAASVGGAAAMPSPGRMLVNIPASWHHPRGTVLSSRRLSLALSTLPSAAVTAVPLATERPCFAWCCAVGLWVPLILFSSVLLCAEQVRALKITYHRPLAFRSQAWCAGKISELGVTLPFRRSSPKMGWEVGGYLRLAKQGAAPP